MAIDMADIESIYDTFLQKGSAKLIELQKEINIEDETIAQVTSDIIVGAMNTSLQAVEMLKRVELLEKQLVTETNRAADIASTTAVRDAQSVKDLALKDKDIALKTEQLVTETNRAADIASTAAVRDAQSVKDLALKDKDIALKDKDIALKTEQLVTETNRAADIASTTAVRDAQSVKDLAFKEKQIATEISRAADVASTTNVRNTQAEKDNLIKDEQYLTQQLQNGGLKYDYTYNADGSVATKTLINGGGKSIYEIQQEKLSADKAFVDEQKIQLAYSVIYNNRIKSLDNYSDTIGNLGVGGFKISSDMWETYFKMINDIYINSGDTPVDSTITTPADITLTKA